ncbi:MAG: PilZ domain-containing protein [Marinicaulis sp.]|nr:PilZ domain-containing protein [Marinicaulis sp.]
MEKIERRLQSIKTQPAQSFEFAQRLASDRATSRRATYKFALAITSDREEHQCVVKDLSATGAKISMSGIAGLPDDLILVIEGYNAPAKARMIWRDENECGIEFILDKPS